MQQSDVPTEFEIEFESNGVNYIYKILNINYIFMISIKPIILIIMSIFMSILIVNMEKLGKHRRYITKG